MTADPALIAGVKATGSQSLLLNITGNNWLLENYRLHHHEKARRVREIRQYAGWAARAELLPMDPPLAVFARAYYKKGTLPDSAAISPMVKAAMDGIVDAGILPDDGPKYVHLTGYGRAERDRTLRGKHSVLIVLTSQWLPF